jgi:hypothetical protein
MRGHVIVVVTPSYNLNQNLHLPLCLEGSIFHIARLNAEPNVEGKDYGEGEGWEG